MSAAHEALDHLKALQKQFLREGFPSSREVFFAWSSEVSAVIWYSSYEFKSSFDDHSTELQYGERVTKDEWIERTKKMFRIVNEAVTFLEDKLARLPAKPAAPNVKARVEKPLDYPSKVTLKWLREHVDTDWWVKLGGAAFVLGAALFGAGVRFGQSKLYVDLTTPAVTPVPQELGGKPMAPPSEARDQLSEFLERGRILMQRCRDKRAPSPDQDAKDWALSVSSYLRKTLGSSYETRFNSEAGIALQPFAPEEPRNNLCNSINNQNAKLDQFSSELR